VKGAKVLCSMGCGADLTAIAKFPRPCYECNKKIPRSAITPLNDAKIDVRKLARDVIAYCERKQWSRGANYRLLAEEVLRLHGDDK